jgi:hypothetical protein
VAEKTTLDRYWGIVIGIGDRIVIGDRENYAGSLLGIRIVIGDRYCANTHGLRRP